MQYDLTFKEILEIKKTIKPVKRLENKMCTYRIDGQNYKFLEVTKLVQEMRKMEEWKKINKWAGSVVGISEK